MKKLRKIPVHLRQFAWYAPHQAWLASEGYKPRHDPGDAKSKHANLTGVDLSGVNLSNAGLIGADLSGANLIRADLSGADLSDANLTGAKLIGVNLIRARLIRAKLIGADLSVADLTDADLFDATLSNAQLSDTWLSGANLSNADLSRANLSGAKLNLAKLTGASFDPVYVDIPVTLVEVRDAILANLDRFDMGHWHSDNNWHNGEVHPLPECDTTHCIAGWAHYLAARRRPELLNPKVNVYLVGRLALGEEATRYFFAQSDDALTWLKSPA